MAMKELANKSMAIRLDAINDLEQIARQDAQKHWKIMKILANFVRKNAPYLPDEKLQKNPRVKIPQDIQAALTAIGRRDAKKDSVWQRLDLSNIDIRGANLNGANLNWVNLNDAILYQANLSGASLFQASLCGAILSAANLSGANLKKANLHGAILSAANLSGANIESANLCGVNLFLAKLDGVNLSEANLCAVET
jgi:Pentapeptide repeats (8 copies)